MDSLFKVDASGLVGAANDQVTFSINDLGTYNYAAEKYSLIGCRGGTGDPLTDAIIPEGGIYTLAQGNMITKFNDAIPSWYSHTVVSQFIKISDDRFLWHYSNQLPAARFIVCDRSDVVPEIPEEVNSTSNKFQVSLNWLDKSNTETAFLIYRRDGLDKKYQEIASVESNTTTYIDAVPESGTYWYRIRSQNQNGASLGSNVVKVDIEE